MALLGAQDFVLVERAPTELILTGHTDSVRIPVMDDSTTTSQQRTWGLVLAVVLLIVGAVVVATTGDSWAVRMILAVVSVDVAVRLYRWSRRS